MGFLSAGLSRQSGKGSTALLEIASETVGRASTEPYSDAASQLKHVDASRSHAGDLKDSKAHSTIGGEPRGQLQSEAFPTKPETLPASKDHLWVYSEQPFGARRAVVASELGYHAVRSSWKQAAVATAATSGAPRLLMFAPAVAAHPLTEDITVPKPARDRSPYRKKVLLRMCLSLPLVVLCWRCAALGREANRWIASSGPAPPFAWFRRVHFTFWLSKS